ncbi:MAG: haloacid dehalogenase-like hydrolase [Clostridia bacterium]|nr:haloacid dehalogenase-like hydrolase [Clostridia bacterium]
MSERKKPIVAIMYDFDKTLSTRDMQEYGFIPSLGISSEQFWGEVKQLQQTEQMDPVLAYLRHMIKRATEKHAYITKKALVALGKDIEYYPGVEEWFERINDYGEKNGVRIEHYVISSGIKEIIEGSSIKSHFKRIYACEFLYDENKVAVWPKLTVNYTNKTQFLFRISKGVLDVWDDEKLNAHMPEEERRVPFRNMIYIGDGLTDVPCMTLVKRYNGQSIAVYRRQQRDIAARLLTENRVDFITEANYCEQSELDTIVKTSIERIAVTEKMAALHHKHKESLKNKQ